MTAIRSEAQVGGLLREWRQRRRLSQLDLSVRAEVSTRHLSYVETGRSRPSRELVLHLAESLDVPLREQNRLLLAAGYAPAFGERSLDDPDLAVARTALERLLSAHEPYPAVIVDRHWNAVVANDAASLFLEGVAPHLLAPVLNVVRVSLHPEGLAPRIVNLADYARHMVARLRHQAELSGDPVVVELLDEVDEHLPDAARGAVHRPADVLVPLVLETDRGEVSMFSTIATFGAPLDATLAELALESFYPADDRSESILRVLRRDQTGAATSAARN